MSIKTELQPLGKNVVVKAIENNANTSAIILTSKEKPQYYKVVAVGDEVTKLKPEDEVVITEYAGKTISVDGTDHIILKDEDIIAKVTTTKIDE